jgi:virulence-associated protein VapD
MLQDNNSLTDVVTDIDAIFEPTSIPNEQGCVFSSHSHVNFIVKGFRFANSTFSHFFSWTAWK